MLDAIELHIEVSFGRGPRTAAVHKTRRGWDSHLRGSYVLFLFMRTLVGHTAARDLTTISVN